MIVIKNSNDQIRLVFLSFHFKNYRTSKHRNIKNIRGVTWCFGQVMIPSRKAMKSYRKNLSQILKKHKSTPINSIVAALVSSIQG
jgi:hypothetical protein